MCLQRDQHVVHRARAVVHRYHQAGAVTAAGLRRGMLLRMRDDREAGAVVGVVLDRRRHHVQPVLAARTRAGDRSQRRIGGSPARPFGVAQRGAAFDVRQVQAQPVAALRQRLRVRKHRLDAVERVLSPQQVVAHEQAGLADDEQRCVQEQVERARDHPLGGVLHRHHTEIGCAGAGAAKHFVDTGAGQAIDGRAEIAQRRLFAEGSGRPEVGHAHAPLQRATGGHDLAPDRGHAGALQRAVVGDLQPLDHLGLALRMEDHPTGALLQFADLLCQRGAPVQQREQFPIDRVDLRAQRQQRAVGGLVGSAHRQAQMADPGRRRADERRTVSCSPPWLAACRRRPWARWCPALRRPARPARCALVARACAAWVRSAGAPRAAAFACSCSASRR
jgi:hypothetical protein